MTVLRGAARFPARTFMAALVTACLPTAASAADWWVAVKGDAQGNVIMAETGSIRREGDLLIIWTHKFYKVPEDGMASALIQYAVDCGRPRLQERRYTDFDKFGNQIDTGDNSDTESLRDVAPGTVGDTIVQFTCSDFAARKAGFLSVDAGADYHDVAKFFLEDGEIVPVK